MEERRTTLLFMTYLNSPPATTVKVNHVKEFSASPSSRRRQPDLNYLHQSSLRPAPGSHMTFFHPTAWRKSPSFLLFALIYSLQLCFSSKCCKSTWGCAGAPSLVCWGRRQWPGFWHLLLESGTPASFQLSRGHAATRQRSLHLPPCTEVVCVKIFNQVFSCQAKSLHHYSSGLNVSIDTFPEKICYFDRLPRFFCGFWASQA